MNGRNRRRSRGFSLIELLIVIAIILIIAVIAVPKYNQSRMLAQEMAAIETVRTIHKAQLQYQAQFGNFAETLIQLGPAANGNPSPAAADLIPNDLAQGSKTGFNFTMQGSKGAYTVLAVPIAYGSTGRRTFFSDQSTVVRETWSSEPANAQSPEIK